MIVFEDHANIFLSGAQTLVCPVNTVGVMGAGLALAFKKRFPECEAPYKRLCLTRELERNHMGICRLQTGRQILFCPTKRHWVNPSNLEWIRSSLKVIRDDYAIHGITSLAIPAIGCGLGQLDWDTDVRPLIIEYLDPIDLKVGIYSPYILSGIS